MKQGHTLLLGAGLGLVAFAFSPLVLRTHGPESLIRQDAYALAHRDADGTKDGANPSGGTRPQALQVTRWHDTNVPVATGAGSAAASRTAESLAAWAERQLRIPSEPDKHWLWCRSMSGGCVAHTERVAAELDADAARHGVRLRLLAAMAWVESKWHTGAVGQRGEQGALQMLPGKREKYGSPAAMLRRCIETCGGSERKALCLWNTGKCREHCPYSARVAAVETEMGK